MANNANAVWPVLTNTPYHTQTVAMRHMPTQFKSGGTSLHPLQRVGLASSDTFPVMPVRSPNGIAGHRPASQVLPIQPPTLAFAGPNRTSHTRVPTVML